MLEVKNELVRVIRSRGASPDGQETEETNQTSVVEEGKSEGKDR